MKRYKSAVLIILAVIITLLSSCGGSSGGKSEEDILKWEGDNMQDFTAEGLNVSDKGAYIYDRTPYEDRLVGVAYTTWHRNTVWENEYWAYPEIGKYRSDDDEIIKYHGKLLGEADVDFVFVDWSNDVAFNTNEYKRATYENIMNEKNVRITGREDFAMIERTAVKMFDIWSKMDEKTPQIAIMLGCPDRPSALYDGGLQWKADQVYEWFLNDQEHPERADKYMIVNGKPLLMVYLGTPTFVIDRDPLEDWNDERFTVRYITGFVTEQPYLQNTETRESKYGYWSWEDRAVQTFAVNKETNLPEAMTVVASYRSQGNEGDDDYIAASGRQDGKIFKEQWARARLIGVRIALVVSWNEYVIGEQINEEISKDLEPNTVYGDKYYQMLKEEIAKFKNK